MMKQDFASGICVAALTIVIINIEVTGDEYMGAKI